jgi:hypothetical protein
MFNFLQPKISREELERIEKEKAEKGIVEPIKEEIQTVEEINSKKKRKGK